MIKIKFLNERVFHNVEFSIVSANVVQLIGDIAENTSGFKTYKQNGTKIGDFSEYTTVYKKVDGGIQFSDNGSKTQSKNTVTFAEMKEKIIALESKNEILKSQLEETQNQLTETQLALCDVYELMGDV